MAGRYHRLTADDYSDEDTAGILRSCLSLRLPPDMRETVVSNLRSMSSHKVTVLNVVLCGREGPLKTSAAEAFSELHPFSNMSEFEKMSLQQIPGLFGKSPEEVRRESSRCISQCDPEGVNAFIHVLPLSPPTDEDKKEFKAIQKTFGSQVEFLSMILFSLKSDQTAADKDKLLEENKDIQELIQSCEGRFFFLENQEHQQFPEQWDAGTERIGRSTSQSKDDLRMVLIGKTGGGKSSTANTILGKKVFTPRVAPKPANTTCEKETGEIDGRTVSVVNTPGLYHTSLSDEEIQEELSKCFSLLAPGPHVFLLVLQIGSISPEERNSVELIKRVFGEKSKDFIIIIFTRGEEVEGQSIKSHIEGCDGFVKKLVDDCGGRYQVFNNKEKNRQQVRELLTKIENMVKENGGSYYNAEMFQLAKEVVKREVKQMVKREQRASKRHQEEIEELKKKLEAQEKEKQENWEAKNRHEEKEEKKREALEREKQQNQRAEKQQEEIEELKKKLEAQEREKQQNQRAEKQQEEIEELKKKMEEQEREKQQNQKDKKHEEEVKKLRQEMREMRETMEKKKKKKECKVS